MQTQIKAKEFSDLLKQFNEATQKLSAYWIDLNNDQLSLAPNMLYPFNKSFDELATEVKEWVKDSCEKLARFEPKRAVMTKTLHFQDRTLSKGQTLWVYLNADGFLMGKLSINDSIEYGLHARSFDFI